MRRQEKGKGKQGNLPRCLFPLSLVLLLLGCGKHKAKADDTKPKKPEKSLVQDVDLGAGSLNVFPNATAGSPSFSVHWKKGGFAGKDGGVDTGHLETVSGDLFQDGKKTSEYSAPRGDAQRATKRLKLTGGARLRSADGTQMMRSDSAEYRDDLKLVRAIGHVTATGPFGTLSGVPEMWATPDLHLIGTPDMFSKTLKVPALVALAATAATGSARFQKGEDYQLPQMGHPLADYRTPGHTKITIQAPKVGPTILIIPSRGLTFRFTGTVLLDLIPYGGTTVVRHFTTAAPVNMVQLAPDGSKTTMDGTSAEYDAKPGADLADLSVGGQVHLTTTTKSTGVKSAGETTTVSKGDKGSAVLRAKPTADENALKSATLTGNVIIDSSGSASGTFSGVGDRMVYVPSVENADVDLTGHVTLTSVTKDKATAGTPNTNTVVSKGEHAHAVLLAKPATGESPLTNAVLNGGVTIDVSGTNGQKFKGSGDKVVYTAKGDDAKAVMTGDLKFAGDTPSFFGNSSGADVATVTIGKAGLETVDLSDSQGSSLESRIKLPPSAVKPPAPKKGKKGGKP